MMFEILNQNSKLATDDAFFFEAALTCITPSKRLLIEARIVKAALRRCAEGSSQK